MLKTGDTIYAGYVYFLFLVSILYLNINLSYYI